MGKREPVALLNLSSLCLMTDERLFLAVPWGCLRFVIVVFPDHTHLLFFDGLPFFQCLKVNFGLVIRGLVSPECLKSGTIYFAFLQFTCTSLVFRDF